MHDEVAALIQNSLEEVKYIDGVSSNEDSEEEDIKEKESEEKAEKSDSSEETSWGWAVPSLGQAWAS